MFSIKKNISFFIKISLSLVFLFLPAVFAHADNPPTCNGQIATIYVDNTNTIVGGLFDGTTYAGNLTGTNGDDVMVSTDGNDVISGGGGADIICGINGNDTLDYSLDSSDHIFTIISGNSGTADDSSFYSIENLIGSSGDDSFIMATSSSVLNGVINGGDGIDILDFTGTRTAAVQINLKTNLASAIGGLVSIENATGTSGNDVIFGSDGANVLHGNLGNDIVSGNGGDDVIMGDSGRNILIGGIGQDVLSGGSDDDILVNGSTSYDNNLTALNAIRNEWTRPGATHAQRVARIFGTMGGGLNGQYKLNISTVFNDGNSDAFYGDAGLDWFLTSTSDIVTDLHNGGTETQTNI